MYVLRPFQIKQGLVLVCITIYYSTKLHTELQLPAELPKAILYPNLLQTTNQSKPKLILYWNSFFGTVDMQFGNGSKIFKHCPVNNCLATSNKKYTSIEKFDAIIFHAARYYVNKDGIPLKRSVHQKYIFYSMESPLNMKSEKLTNFYNLTMTYRNDSDIYKPYGMVVANKTNYVLPTVQEIKSKTKKVAWFVSNCYLPTTRRRIRYVNELSKYIPVDIYGRCGNLKCDNRSECYKMLEKDYKFYLSFENAICKEYVTEKVFNVLKYNVVPIVLGIFDYGNLVPPNSVISTGDFNKPYDLAKFLWKLDANPKKYVKYFEWKKSFSVITNIKKYVLCSMCQLLNQPLVYSWYENVPDWFYGFNCVV